MSGVKGRSGRRPDAERLHCRELIRRATTEDDWIKLFRTLARRARAGSAAHARILLAYMFGQPTEQPNWLESFEADLAKALESLAAETEAENQNNRLAPPAPPSLPAKTE